MAVQRFQESTKNWTKEELDLFRMTHVMKAGDDGIPNIRSVDNALIDKIRQKPISTEFITNSLTCGNIEEHIRSTYGEDAVRNYYRNRTLVDLDYIPKEIENQIIDKYESSKRSGMQRNKFLNYLISNRLSMLAECSGDF